MNSSELPQPPPPFHKRTGACVTSTAMNSSRGQTSRLAFKFTGHQPQFKAHERGPRCFGDAFNGTLAVALRTTKPAICRDAALQVSPSV